MKYKILIIKKEKIIFKNIYFIRIYSLLIIFLPFFKFWLYIITFISTKFNQIIESKSNQELFSVFISILLIFVRTVLVYLLKKKSFSLIFKKKNIDEKKIIDEFIKNRIFDYKNNDSIEVFKESLINSSNLAAVNFDLPICSIIAEIIFALGGIIIIINLLGIKILLFNIPILPFCLFFPYLFQIIYERWVEK